MHRRRHEGAMGKGPTDDHSGSMSTIRRAGVFSPTTCASSCRDDGGSWPRRRVGTRHGPDLSTWYTAPNTWPSTASPAASLHKRTTEGREMAGSSCGIRPCPSSMGLNGMVVCKVYDPRMSTGPDGTEPLEWVSMPMPIRVSRLDAKRHLLPTAHWSRCFPATEDTFACGCAAMALTAATESGGTLLC